MTEITLDGLTKVYSDSLGEETAVDDLSLEIPDGEFVVIVGPSGCGKSTTLRMIAGLETVTEGTIRFGEEEVQDLAPVTRDVAMVFQNYALYPSMSAKENIGYGLKHSTDLPKKQRAEKVAEAAAMLDIEDVLDNSPDELSGGQKQRVALGRAIVREPSVFLLDEPLSNLDAKLRAEMRHEIQRIHQTLGITTIYVTHDQKEAMTMADRIAVLGDGKLQQVATPEELYNDPANRFVAGFIGSPSMNILDVTTEREGGALSFFCDDIELCSVDVSTVSYVPDETEIGVRPQHLNLTEAGTDTAVQATVLVPEYQGKTNFIHVELANRQLTARTDPSVFPETDSTVHLHIAPSDLYVFDAETGETVKAREWDEMDVGRSRQKRTF